MDGKSGDLAHGFPEVLAQGGMDEDQILEFVAFELAGHGIGQQRQEFAGLGADDMGAEDGVSSVGDAP